MINFRQRVLQLAAQPQIDDTTFAETVYAAMAEHGLDPARLSAETEIGAETLERWYQGRNLPQPQVRAKILLLIAGLLK